MRILARHPRVTLTAALGLGHEEAPRPLPALARIWDGEVAPLDVGPARRRRSTGVVPGAARSRRRRAGAELLAARRAASSTSPARSASATTPTAQRWYPATAALPAGTVYGLSERHRDGDPRRAAGLVPGLLSDRGAAALGRWPPPACSTATVIVDAKSGISGAGKTPSERTHFSENHGSVAAYGIFSHRHTAEIEQELGGDGDVRAAPGAARSRHPRDDLRRASSRARPRRRSPTRFDAAYADAPFVRLTGDALPEIKHVAHTNFCDIGWKVDRARPARAVVVACSTTW